jgi:hypothetical protein
LSQGVLQHLSVLLLWPNLTTYPLEFSTSSRQIPSLLEFLDPGSSRRGLEDESVAIFIVVIGELPKGFPILKEVLEDQWRTALIIVMLFSGMAGKAFSSTKNSSGDNYHYN